MKRSKLAFAIIAILLLALLVVIGASFGAKLINKKYNPVEQGRSALEAEGNLFSVTVGGEKYNRREGIESYLLIGLDTFGPLKTNNGYYNKDQADYLLLITVDSHRNKVSFLNINRDTICEVTQFGVGGIKYGTRTEQIALAHTYGDGMEVSCENVVDALEKLLLGTKIDYYAAITMDGVQIINDYIGGVEVDGELLLGEDALSYVRRRIGFDDSTNIARMERQNKYMSSFGSKLQQTELSMSYIDGLVSAVADYTLTNANVLKLYDWLEKVQGFEIGTIISPDGEADYSGEFVEFNVDKDNLNQIVLELFYAKN